ncbi:MAG: DivIVA domain-containing protein [Gemmatimonadota bacterium]
MIDLTPLDVRKKKGDFRKGIRGYEVPEVDGFLDMVAERMEELVRENTQLREKEAHLSELLDNFRGREQAMNEALVGAQQLRAEIRSQTERDSELMLREAKAEGERLVNAARGEVEQLREELRRVQTQRDRFLRGYRNFLEGQLGEVALEEERVVRSRAGELDSELNEPGDD